MTTTQTSLLAFDAPEVPAGPRWLEGSDGHRSLCRTDAEALVESLNSMPTGKGMWLRCLEIDRNAPYNAWRREWSAAIWWQNGIGLEKLVDHDGNAKDFIDPYPLKHYYLNGKQVRPLEHQEVRDAWIDGDVLRLELPSGEWTAEIYDDSEIRRYDRHPYDPSTDLEHFAIECYRHRLPESMFAWREHYVYGTPALRPFSRTMSEEEAKRIDTMGRIPGILAPNEMFNQICGCAEAMGIGLNLRHDVPALQNLSMHPNERTCRSCMRKGCSNWRESNPCWERDQCGGCFSGYMWDRKTPSRRRGPCHASRQRPGKPFIATRRFGDHGQEHDTHPPRPRSCCSGWCSHGLERRRGSREQRGSFRISSGARRARDKAHRSG